MPHLSPMTWYFISEILLVSIIFFGSVIWWSYNTKVGVKLGFKDKSLLCLPWN